MARKFSFQAPGSKEGALTPEQIQENDIKVLIDSSTSSAFASDSIQQIFKGQSVGAGI